MFWWCRVCVSVGGESQTTEIDLCVSVSICSTYHTKPDYCRIYPRFTFQTLLGRSECDVLCVLPEAWEWWPGLLQSDLPSVYFWKHVEAWCGLPGTVTNPWIIPVPARMLCLTRLLSVAGLILHLIFFSDALGCVCVPPGYSTCCGEFIIYKWIIFCWVGCWLFDFCSNLS